MLANTEFFYSEITKKTIVAYGSLFSNIKIERYDNNGVKQNSIRVPIAYGPRDKTLVRLRQDPNLNDSTQIDLPRMAFEFSGYNYIGNNTLNKNNYMVAPDGKTQYTPVSYDLSFNLYIYTKNQDDGFAIVEQILPWFQPDLTVQIKMNEALGISQNVPFTLNSCSIEDSYYGKFEERRAIIHTLSFTARVNYFRPVTQYMNGVIKKVIVGIDVGNSNVTSSTYTAAVNPVTAEKSGNYTIDEIFSGTF